MKKKKFFAPLVGALVLGLSAYAGYRTYDAYDGVSESDLLLANAEALGGAIEDWWNSKTHDCVEDQCSITIGPITWYGKYEKCLDGDSYAHCTDCKMCDAVSAN